MKAISQKGDEQAGVWWGAGAAKLGLTGQVHRETLRNLLLGVSRDGKTELVRNARHPHRRSAFDLTFSVPKSVSVLWSQANVSDRIQIERACENALYKVLEVFERRCGVTRRGHLGARTESAKLIAAIFRHETSRGLPGEVPDPNLHWHVLVINASVREDGTTGAFDARRLFAKDMKLMLGAMFRAELSRKLELLGLTSYRPQKETGTGKVSWFELNGVPVELIKAMSKRRMEITEWLTKHGLSGTKMAEKAALHTRRKKESYSRKQLFTAWRNAGRDHGFTRNKINTTFTISLKPRNLKYETDAAIKRALTRITEERSHFTERELVRFSAEEGARPGCWNQGDRSRSWSAT